MSNIFDSENLTVSALEISKSKVENLKDRPNLAVAFGGDGLSAKELKASFDKIGVYVATRLKNLNEALKSSDAGQSIGIVGFEGEQTSIKEMLNYLSTTKGASVIGTGRSINGENATLQEVIDNVYQVIDSYELDDVFDIKTILGYNESDGSCANFEFVYNLAIKLSQDLDKIEEILGVADDLSKSQRIDNVEKLINEIKSLIGVSSGIATLNMEGKLNENVDASHITSGKLPLSVIPDSAFERTKIVQSKEEMFNLTNADVQEGDIVVVEGSPDKWYKVIDENNLSNANGYREIIGGTTAVAQMAREFDSSYSGGNSINEEFNKVKGDIAQNLTAINNLQSKKVNYLDLKMLMATHSYDESQKIHTFTTDSNFPISQDVKEYLVRAKMTASISAGDTFTITDGTTTINGILPKTEDGKDYAIEFSSGVFPTVLFNVDIGGSEKHAFFKSGGRKFASGIFSGTENIVENSIYSTKFFCLDPSVIGFVPNNYYSITRYRRNTTVSKYIRNTTQALGFFYTNDNRDQAQVLMALTVGPDSLGREYATSYNCSSANITISQAIPNGERWVALLTTDDLTDIDYCEWYAWE